MINFHSETIAVQIPIPSKSILERGISEAQRSGKSSSLTDVLCDSVDIPRIKIVRRNSIPRKVIAYFVWTDSKTPPFIETARRFIDFETLCHEWAHYYRWSKNGSVKPSMLEDILADEFARRCLEQLS
ncbi:MAG: hypothetical protein ACYCPW_03780 [Nitrososphaerales archaeon]